MSASMEPHSLRAAVGVHPLVLGHLEVLQDNHFVIVTLKLKDASEGRLLELALSLELGTLHSLSLYPHTHSVGRVQLFISIFQMRKLRLRSGKMLA